MRYRDRFPAAAEQHAARPINLRSLQLLDLHQNLLVNICRVLSVWDKVQLRLVCKLFHSLLDDPAPGSGIWGVVDIADFKDDLCPMDVYRQAPSCLILGMIA